MRRPTALLGISLLLAAAATAYLVLRQGPPPPAPDGAGGTGGESASAAGGFDRPGDALAAGLPGGQRQAAAGDVGGASERFATSLTGFAGRIVQGTGVPVPGCRVRLFRAAPDIALQAGVRPLESARNEPQIEAARDETDEDGRFFLDGVFPHALYVLRADFEHPAEVPEATLLGQATYRIVQHTPAPGEVVDLGDIRLKEGAVLTGRVVDERGQPLAGALVRAVQMPGAPFQFVPLHLLRPDGGFVVRAGSIGLVLLLPPWVERVLDALPIARTETDRDGTFRLFGVDPGENVFAVTAPEREGHLVPRILLDPGEVRNLGEIVLGDGETAVVRVVDAAGEPVPGVEVLIAPVSTGPPAHVAWRAGVTDGEGLLAVPGLPRGRVLGAVRRSHRDPWIVGEPQPVDAELQFVLGRTFALTLSVLAPGGERLPEPRLQVLGGEVGAEAIGLSLFGLNEPVPLAGRLRRLEDGRLRIEDLPGGSYTVLAGAPGCAVTALDIELRADAEHDLRLRPEVAVEVTVRDAAGGPVEAASVYVQPRGSRIQRLSNLPFLAGQTDAEGRLRVALPTELARLTASHPAYGNTHLEMQAPAPSVELVFGQPGAIAGELTDGGRPPEPGRWLMVLERRRQTGERGAFPDLPKLTVPDLEGRFAFTGLQPGRYRVTAQDSMDEVGTIGGVVGFFMRRRAIYPWARQEVEVRAGATAEVRFDALLDTEPHAGPGAVISGTVTRNGQPAVGALVAAHSYQGERDVVRRVDPAGRFDLGLVPAGRTRLTVLPKSVVESRRREDIFNHYWAQDLEVVDGQPIWLPVEITTGSLSGVVFDARGQPVEGCRVQAIGEARDGISTGLLSARTDARGRFVFDDLPAGPLRLRAQRDGVGEAERTGLQIAGGLEAGPVEIVLAPWVEVRGRLVLAEGQQARGMRIELRPLPERPGARRRTGCRRDGSFRLRNVRPGDYLVSVHRPGAPPWMRPEPLRVGAQGIADLELRLPP